MPEQHYKGKLYSRENEGNIVTKFKGIAEEDNQVYCQKYEIPRVSITEHCQ